MTATIVSRWSRRFVSVGALFLVAWQFGAVLGVSRDVQVYLGVTGFVYHVIFGKAYSLVPTYFDRSLSVTRAPAVQFPLSVLGTIGLVAGRLGPFPVVELAGALLWAGGIAVFVGSLGWTVRGNLTGAETATGGANAARRGVDRYANAFVPIVLGYVLVGSYELLASVAGLPSLLAGSLPRVAHLLAAGGAGLLVFAVGFRLLPRFLVAHPPRWLVAVVLPAGAVGPAIIAATLPVGPWFQVGASLEATAVIGFALAYAVVFARSDRRRVGFYGVLAGVTAGALAALLGLTFAFDGMTLGRIIAHFRLNVLGLLGLTIVGVTYQFYPPAIGSFPGAGDRTAMASLVLLSGGLLVEVGGLVTGLSSVTLIGRLAGLAGAVAYAWLVGGLFFGENR